MFSELVLLLRYIAGPLEYSVVELVIQVVKLGQKGLEIAWKIVWAFVHFHDLIEKHLGVFAEAFVKMASDEEFLFLKLSCSYTQLHTDFTLICHRAQTCVMLSG